MSDQQDITSDSALRKLRYRLRMRSEKCANEGFHIDSALFERAADAIEAMQAERRESKEER